MSNFRPRSLMERAMYDAGRTYRAQITVGSTCAEPARVLKSAASFESSAEAIIFARTAANILFPAGSLRGRSLTANVVS